MNKPLTAQQVKNLPIGKTLTSDGANRKQRRQWKKQLSFDQLFAPIQGKLTGSEDGSITEFNGNKL